ncbi:hypothetical protein P3X46_023003 [Hevea brasiliensis]|uniref:Protein kinase domain-containing protein n=1 Tax=Hevea brasiliensis TaxID=3981 RepID=A0ABQ9LAR5_HEVBR|nr:hypothetical protein P3X46_023003 [Hevea brasiliensis]
MAAVSLFILLALFHPAFSFPCRSFPCGELGEIFFPFTNNETDERCGPFVVDGCNEEIKKVQLGRGSQKWYQIERIFRDPFHYPHWSEISITDIELQSKLNSRKCESFQNLSLPSLPYANFKITSKLTTLHKCNSSKDYPKTQSHYNNYSKCPNFKIYYTRKENASSSQSPPPKCPIVNLPLNRNNSHDDIFQILTANFSLRVRIRPDFYNCYLHGGKCRNNNGGFNCTGAEEDTIKSFPALPTSLEGHKGIGFATVGMIISMFIIFFWLRNKRKQTSSNIVPRNSSADIFSISDREGGNIFFGVSIFCYNELEKATNSFASENELGDGGFGAVYYGKLQDGREVAVKRLYERNYCKVQQFLNEIALLTRLRHKNLVSLYGCTSRRSRELLLVYEYIPNGTVADHLRGDQASSSPLTWPIRMRIAIETASALVFLHASDVIHRDVKTNNILLDNYFSVKIADFGISRLFPIDVTHISTAPQGTPGYLDPEYYQCFQLTDKSDVYSFGVVLVELLSSLPAVDRTRHRHEINLAKLAINKIKRSALDELIDPCLGYHSDEEVKRMTTCVAELAFLCLQEDSELRPTMGEVLEELKRIESRGDDSENPEEQLDNA